MSQKAKIWSNDNLFSASSGMEELPEITKPATGRKRPRFPSSTTLSAFAGLLGLAILGTTQV